MAKYMIQDIIPPERKKPAPHAKTAARQHAGKPHLSHLHHAPKEEEIETTVSHAIHHEETLKEGSHEIHDQLIERPQEMILENLYHKEEAPNQSVNDTGGVYPYNTASTANYKDDPARSSWKFPETTSLSGVFGGWIPWVLVPLVLLVGGFFLMNHFSGATVTLVPKHETLTIPEKESFIAKKSPGEGELGFSVMKVSLDDTREVSATGTKTVTAKASGRIMIYNEQTVIQRLIKNTRFQSAVGKIYRINDSINVPKATVKGGKTTPGTIEVTVYADEAGPDYNSQPTDFSVPGLKNTPQAKLVYARSNGPISGGASGTVKSVTDQELKQAGEDLRVSLETKLRTKARGDLGPNQIAYDQGIIVSIGEPRLSGEQASASDKAIVTETGTLYMIVFDRASLAKAIAQAIVPTYKGEPIEITNIDALTLGTKGMSGDELFGLERLDFTLSGTPSIVWQVDTERIKKSLVGVAKSNFNLILGQYSNIDRAKASVQPMWKSAFPDDEKSITVKLVEEIPN